MNIPMNIIKMTMPVVTLTSVLFPQYAENLNIQDNVPDGAYNRGYYPEKLYIPEGYSAGAFWLQAATLTGNDADKNKPAKIFIDYMKVIEKDLKTGKEKVIQYEDYKKPARFLDKHKGGLYYRFPKWYCCGDNHEPITYASKIFNDNLLLDISKHPDRIYHWWSNRFKTSKDKNYILEVRFKVEDNATISLGFDHWRNMNASWNGLNVNNTQAFVSDWHGDTEGKYVILKELLVR